MPPLRSTIRQPTGRVFFVCGGILGSHFGSALVLTCPKQFSSRDIPPPSLSRGAEPISKSQSAEEKVNHLTSARRRAQYGRAEDSKSNRKFPKREFFYFSGTGNKTCRI